MSNIIYTKQGKKSNTPVNLDKVSKVSCTGHEITFDLGEYTCWWYFFDEDTASSVYEKILNTNATEV